MAGEIKSPVVPSELEKLEARMHGSLCDELAKLGQFDILIASFMEFVWDGCNLTDDFKSFACDKTCSTTTTTTTCFWTTSTSSTSTTSTTTCAIPATPTITVSGGGSLNGWVSTSPGYEYIEIYREEGEEFVLYDTTELEAYNPEDSGTYKVKACNSCGCSDFSNEVSA